MKGRVFFALGGLGLIGPLLSAPSAAGRASLIEKRDPSGHLQRRLEDTNFDGRIDRITRFYKSFKIPTERRLSDLNGDGHFERRENWFFEQKNLRVQVQELQGSRRSWRTLYSSRLPLQMEDAVEENIVHETPSSKQNELTTPGSKFVPVHRYRDRLLAGFQVDEECETTFGGGPSAMDRVERLLRRAVQDGMACVDRLGTATVRAHRLRAQGVLNGKPIPRLVCSDETVSWGTGKGDHLAQATSSAAEPDFPLISLNPRQIYPNKERYDTEVAALLFHEFFHLLGYRHGSDVEYPYACGECCFSVTKDSDVQARACQICAARSESKNINYLKNLTQLMGDLGRPQVAAQSVLLALKEKPMSRALRVLLAQSYTPAYDPEYGAAYRVVLGEKYKKLKYGERTQLSLEPFQKALPKLTGTSVSWALSDLARAQLELFEGNLPEAERLLRGQRKALEELSKGTLLPKALLERRRAHFQELAWDLYLAYEANPDSVEQKANTARVRNGLLD